MREKKLIDKVAEEVITETQKEEVYNKIMKTLNTDEIRTSHKRYSLNQMLTVAVCFAIIMIISISIFIMLKPNDIPSDNILQPTPSEPITPPIHYGNSDLMLRNLDTLAELEGIYDKNLVIEGYVPSLIKLYYDKNDESVIIYLDIIYVPEILDDMPWDNNNINIKIILINGFDDFIGFDSEHWQDSMSITIEDQLQEIKYYTNLDYEFMFMNARTKLEIDGIRYFIAADYFAPTEEGNVLERIIGDLF